MVIGIVLGCLAVPAYLAYKGEKPINVMVVFFGLIVLPWLITAHKSVSFLVAA